MYKTSKEVPTDVIINRLNELSRMIVDQDRKIFTLNVPAELDKDADMVLSLAAERLKILSNIK